MSIKPEELVLAHKMSSRHREYIELSHKCACFYCLKTFQKDEIVQWVDNNGQTALCPYCNIDAVLGDYIPFELTDEFLKEMNVRWFTTNRADTLPEPVKQVIVMRTDLNMRKGKMVAQGSHASIAFLCRKMQNKDYEFTEAEKSWVEGTFAKVCVGVGSEEELLNIYREANSRGVLVSLITDSGRTEFNGVQTNTCLAVGPDFNSKIDPITKHLKLL